MRSKGLPRTTAALMRRVPLVATRCAICGIEGGADEVYPANVDADTLDDVIFSARRPPDGIHFRMVRCRTCGLIRSDPIVPADHLARLYAESHFDESEVTNLRRTYGRVLDELDRHGARKDALLEIGSGTGFFLEEARTRGYRRTVGVEPSLEAAAEADRRTGVETVRDVMRPGLFPAGSFDVICIFQTLDHLPDPADVLDECRRVLRPAGLVLAFNHDTSALSARLLGERSPIVDVEHTYLYDPRTMRRLFESRGFEVLAVGPVRNLNSIRYLLHLTPLPGPLKALARTVLAPVAGARLWVPLGNLRLIARRPEPA